jgi:hypothetical protein
MILSCCLHDIAVQSTFISLFLYAIDVLPVLPVISPKLTRCFHRVFAAALMTEEQRHLHSFVQSRTAFAGSLRSWSQESCTRCTCITLTRVMQNSGRRMAC